MNMDDIDRALHALATAPLPTVTDIEHNVMSRIDAAMTARAARPSLGAGVTTASLAMIIGIAVAGAPGRTQSPQLELSVFSANAELAPATLLAIER